MRIFEEFIDYEFINESEVVETIGKNPTWSYVIVKDTGDYSADAIRSDDDTARVNKILCLLVKSSDKDFVTNCLSYAMTKHVQSITSYQADFCIKNK